MVLDKWAAKAVDKVIYEGDRVMLVKLRGKPTDVVILQIYIPTSEAEEELVVCKSSSTFSYMASTSSSSASDVGMYI